jgi:hypothetical protein
MSLEENKNNIDLKDLYDLYEYEKKRWINRQTEFNKIENTIKMDLKKAIENLKSNSQYNNVTSEEEKNEINQLYNEVSNVS